MKMVKIAVALFEKGDRVLTCEGFGTIQEDEDPTTAIYYRKNIRIKLDEASTKWGSCEGFMDPDLMIPYFDHQEENKSLLSENETVELSRFPK